MLAAQRRLYQSHRLSQGALHGLGAQVYYCLFPVWVAIAASVQIPFGSAMPRAHSHLVLARLLLLPALSICGEHMQYA